jgi:putative lipoprotein
MPSKPLLAVALGCSVACGSEPASMPAMTADQPPSSATVDPWQRARDRGIDFRAVGQEPGWYLEVDYQGSIRLVYDYGEREISAAAPPPSAEPGRPTLEVMTDSGRVAVLIEERPCHDVMSGQRLSATVTVDIGSRRLEGCGRALDGRD